VGKTLSGKKPHLHEHAQSAYSMSTLSIELETARSIERTAAQNYSRSNCVDTRYSSLPLKPDGREASR
jgi:hypothetical protein